MSALFVAFASLILLVGCVGIGIPGVNLIISFVEAGTWNISETLIEDRFDCGALDMGTWCYADLYGNPGNYGVLPEVIYEDSSHGCVMHFDAPGAGMKQRVGALITTRPLLAGETVVASMEVRRNTAETVFAIHPRKMTVLDGEHFGCITAIPETSCWSWPKITYWPGVNSDYLYPNSGFWIRMPNTLSCCSYDDYYVTDIDLEAGVWYLLEMALTSDTFSLYVDGAEVFSVSNPYYSFDRTDDWLFLVGDNDTEKYAPCDLSVDNVFVGIGTRRD